MKHYLLFLVLLISVCGYGQNKKLLFDNNKFFLWNAVTGSNVVTDTDVFLYGSFTKTKVPEDSLDDFGSGDVRAGTTSASKYITKYRLAHSNDFSANIDGWYDLSASDYQYRQVATERLVLGIYTIWYMPEDYGYYALGVSPSDKILPVTIDYDYFYVSFGDRITASFSKADSTFIDSLGVYEVQPYETSVTVANPIWYHKNFTSILNGTDGDSIKFQWREDRTTHFEDNGGFWAIDNFKVTFENDSVRTLARSISLDDLVEDTTYTYYTSVLQPNGRYSKGDDSTFATPLLVPYNFTVETNIDSALLNWLAQDNSRITSYVIYAADSLTGTFSAIDTVYNQFNYSHYVGYGTTKFYKLKTYNPASGNQSNFSNVGSIKTESLTDSLSYSLASINFGQFQKQDSVLTIDSTITSVDTSWTHTDTTWVCTDSSSFISGGAEIGGAFIDDFEEGNSTDYDAVAGGYENPSVISGAARHGSYGFGTVYDGGASYASYGDNTFTDSDNQVWTRFYVKLSSNWNTTGTFKSVYFKEIRTATNYVFRFGAKSDGSGNPTTWSWAFNDSTGTTSASTGTNFSTNAWHLVEIHWKGNDASTGGVQVWVDSTSILSDFARNTNGLTLTTLRTGTASSSSGVTMVNTAYTYMDDIRLDTTARVPAYTANDGDTTWTCTDSTVSAIDSVSTIDTTYSYDTTYVRPYIEQDVVITNNGDGTVSLESYTGLAEPFTNNTLASEEVLYPTGKDTVHVKFYLDGATQNNQDTLIITSSYEVRTIPIAGEIISSTVNTPTNLAVTHNTDTTGFYITWTSTPSSDSTRIYYSASGSAFIYLTSIPNATTNYTHTTFPEGTTRYYKISAITSGNESNLSNTASYTLPYSPSGGVARDSFYVDVNLGSNGNGLSRATAWNSVSNIVWGSLGAGDALVFVGGYGTDTTYINSVSMTIGASGVSGEGNDLEIVGVGNVVWDRNSTSSTGTIIFSGRSYITLKNHLFRDGGQLIRFNSSGTSVTIENCRFEVSYDAGIYAVANSSVRKSGYNGITIKNCTFISGNGAGGNDTDLITCFDGQNYVIEDCWFENRNTYPTVHSDCIQFSRWHNIRASRNYILHFGQKTDNGMGNAQNLYSTITSGYVQYDNNVALHFSAYSWNSILTVQDDEGTVDSVYMFNNTIYSYDIGNAIELRFMDNGQKLVTLNNVVYVRGINHVGGLFLRYRDNVPTGTVISNHNVVYLPNASNPINWGGTGTSWNTWLNTYNQEANSTYGNPNFISVNPANWDVRGDDAVLDGIGINLYNLAPTDIEGNPRPSTGSWRAGAYE